MIDWTLLSLIYLTAMVEWAGAVVVTALATGPDRATGELERTER